MTTGKEKTDCESIPSDNIRFELSASKDYYTVVGVNDVHIGFIIIPSEYNGLPVKKIATNAFADCVVSLDVKIPKSIDFIGETAFDNSHAVFSSFRHNRDDCRTMFTFVFCHIHIIYEGTLEDWCKITFEHRAFPLNSVKGFVCRDNEGRYSKIYHKLIVPDTVTSIGHLQFSFFENLESVEISEGVTSIGANAFLNCRDLKEVKLPSSVKQIGHLAFFDCSSGLKIYYAGTIEDWCNIDFASGALPNSNKGNQFYIKDGDGYRNVEELILPDTMVEIKDYQFYYFTDLKRVVLPEGLVSIGKGAFYDISSLESIVIPKSLKKIEELAFFAEGNLMDVFYLGDKSSWEKIDIGKRNEKLTLSKILFYSVKKPVVDGDYWHYVDGAPTKW